MLRLLLPALLLLLPAACATSRFEANVTRFHTAPPAAGQSVAIQPVRPEQANSLEFQAQASAVAAELQAIGFRIAPAASADLVATLGVDQAFGQAAPRRSPITIGVGGATGGSGMGGVGVGGSVGIPVGGSGSRELLATEMTLSLRRRSDNEMVWEGRAAATVAGKAPGPEYRLLARALLSEFPGESGKTVRWVAR
ncbi:MAG: DUF4136 domain-containing protein [Sphingomonadaceae bacterium]